MQEQIADVILVVDDNVVNCDILHFALRKRGYDVRLATGGAEALAAVAEVPPQLILLDVAMPELDGYEVCLRLKADPKTAEIPIIFLSALDDPGDKVRAFQVGGADYIVKPFETTELVARIENQLKLVRLQREVTAKNAEVLRKNEEILRENEEILRKNAAILRMREDLNSARDAVVSVFSSLSLALPGKVLDDKYLLVELVGTGGSGAVFKGMHLVLEREVAVKVLQPSPLASPQELDRVRKEGVTACSVEHPNAVELWDAGVTKDGLAYLVMELLVGRSLRAELLESGSLSLERCAEIVLPVCDVLAVAHAAGVVHRDIKPDNIFLHHAQGVEIVKVVDFGIAKLVGPARQGGRGLVPTLDMMGTPEYIAPERFTEAMLYDGRADVYSVGVMVYEMLCGRVPFRASREFPWAVASMHMEEPPTPLHELNPAIPEEVESVVLRALAKDYEARPDAREFGDAFLAAVQSQVEATGLRKQRRG